MSRRRTLALLGSAMLALPLALPACQSASHRTTSNRDSAGGRQEAPAGRIDRDGFRRDIRSGTLTAGHFDDAEDPDRFADWADQAAVLGESHGFIHGFEQPAIQLNLYNEDGDPVHDATVVLNNADRWLHAGRRQNVPTIRSGTDGRCVVLPGFDGLDDGTLDLTISAPGARPVRHRVRAHPGDTIDIEVRGASSQLPEKLDLALVIDTTGSMADELEFLKVEFRAIVERIADRFPHVDQRWALVVYRDQGDAYVVREDDFTGSLDRAIDRLGRQSAGGGGDYPEAVDEALRCAVGLGWRDDAAKVAFLIADAPPHAERALEALRQSAAMRAEGIALYPVASSGVKAEAEYLFRAGALMTGGGYTFLTDDSGVGRDHADPHEAPTYDIQRLDDLIVQLVEAELTGRSHIPRRRDVVRQVDAEDAQHPHARPTAQQVRDWRERRETLAELVRTTELTEETRLAVDREIEMLDRRLTQTEQ